MVAVEANAGHCEAAKANIALNSAGNVRLVHAAISDRDGTLDFTLGHRVANGDARIPSVPVPARSTDSLVSEFGEPSLILMDIEGYEAIALRGAIQTLAMKPDWMVEVHSGCGLEEFGGSLQEIIDAFDSYQLSELKSGRFHLTALPRTA